MDGDAPSGDVSGATGREAVQEADEVQDIETGRGVAAAGAVGIRVARGEMVEEAGEVQDVEDGRGGGVVAVGVAVGRGKRGDPALAGVAAAWQGADAGADD